jgi:hypothetical protein
MFFKQTVFMAALSFLLGLGASALAVEPTTFPGPAPAKTLPTKKPSTVKSLPTKIPSTVKFSPAKTPPPIKQLFNTGILVVPTMMERTAPKTTNPLGMDRAFDDERITAGGDKTPSKQTGKAGVPVEPKAFPGSHWKTGNSAPETKGTPSKQTGKAGFLVEPSALERTAPKTINPLGFETGFPEDSGGAKTATMQTSASDFGEAEAMIQAAIHEAKELIEEASEQMKEAQEVIKEVAERQTQNVQTMTGL